MFLKLLQEFRLGFHLGLIRVWESVCAGLQTLRYITQDNDRKTFESKPEERSKLLLLSAAAAISKTQHNTLDVTTVHWHIAIGPNSTWFVSTRHIRLCRATRDERVEPRCSNMADDKQAIVLACTSLIVFMLLHTQILFVSSNKIN